MAESGMETDDWMEQALADPAVVAEMLMSLRAPQAETLKVSQASDADFPGSWGAVRKRPRTVAKLVGWCYSEIRQREEPEQRGVEEKGKAGSPLTLLWWNECVALGGGIGDGSGSSSDDRKGKAERMMQAAGTPDDGVTLKDAAGKVNASSVLSKRTAVKKKSITVLRAEESRLLTANENLEKELKMLKENYVILLQQNNCLKTLHERMPIVSSEKAAIPAAADESKQGTNAHCQEPIPCEDYRPVPLQTSRIPDYIRDPAFFVRACKEVFALPDLNLLAEDDGRER